MWDLRYRPQKFSDVLGQQGAVTILRARLQKGTDQDTNYIFSGGPGQGKTTLARILAKAVLCTDRDPETQDPCNKCENCEGVQSDTSAAFVERDAASNGTVDHMRAIVDDLPFAVYGAAKRIYLFDECHRMSKDAQDVLLKPLEEKRMLGIFCTTEPEKIRGAIRTRCEEYQIRKITREDIFERMKMVLETEKVEFETDGVMTVIDFCGGGVRDTLNKLEMIAQMGPVSLEAARSYLNLSVVSTYYEILLALPTQPRLALELLDRACDRVTPEEVASGLAEAAMNSYRLANGMVADFAYADRTLGQKVYELYQAQTIKLTEHFMRSKYATRVGLVCDLVTLGEAFRGGAPLAAPVVAAPVMVQVQALPSVQQAPPSVPQTAPLPAPSVPLAPTPAPVVAAPAPPPVAAPLKPGLRSDGVGNRGADPMALTDLDSFGVPRNLPKQNTPPVPLNFGNDTRTQDEGRKTLTPAEWRRGFEEHFHTLRSGGL